MVAAMGKESRKKCPYVTSRVGGLRRGNRLWGIIGWLGLDGGIGREGPQLEVGRLIGLEGPTLKHGRLDRQGVEERLGTRRELDLILGLVRRDGKVLLFWNRKR